MHLFLGQPLNRVRHLDTVRTGNRLITRILLPGRADDQRRLVRQLRDGRVTALGFGAGVVFDDVPAALLEEAARCGFPVFSVPLPTPFRGISRFIEGSLLSDDLYTLRRTVSMQRYLMEALAGEEPKGEVVRRLASLLDGCVALFDASGQVEAIGGEEDLGAVWAAIAQTGSGGGEFRIGARTTAAVPIVTRGEVCYWLASTVGSSGAMRRVAGQVIESARYVLQVVARVPEESARERRATRSRLLRDVLQHHAQHPEAEHTAVRDRAASHGLDLRVPARTLVLAPVGDPAEGSPQWRERTQRFVARALMLAHAPHLVGAHGGGVVAVVQRADEIDLEALLDGLDERGLRAHCGVGRAFSSIGGAARSLADAEVALRQARRGAGPETRSLVWHEDLQSTEWVLNLVDPSTLRQRTAALLDALPDHAPLRETLACFFAANLNVAATARAMNLHPNSLRYRLGRYQAARGMRFRMPRCGAA